MKNLSPYFSVVIPTYNSESFIKETLISVIEQTYTCFEVIISDDGSTDNTIKEVKNTLSKYPHIKYETILNPHRGPGATRNIGVNKSNYPWIALLDSDDLWDKNKLKEVSESIEANPESNLFFHDEIVLENNSKKELIHGKFFNNTISPFMAIYRENFLSPSATVFKKEVFLKTGGFDPSLGSAQDYDLWIKMSLQPSLKIHYLPRFLSVYTIREGNITSNIAKRIECMLQIHKNYKKEVFSFSSSPRLDLMRFKGRALSTAGLRWVYQKKYLLGLSYIFKGFLYWPRFDWLKKLTCS